MGFSLIYFYLIVFGIIALVFIKKIWEFSYSYFFWGAINVPSTREKAEKMVKLLEIKPEQTIVDLGAGEGRLLIILAKAGAKAYGYEINPFLVSRARKNIKNAGQEDRAFIFWGNFWRQNLKKFDAVVVYGMTHMMKSLENKFKDELKPGAKIVSNHFTLPTWKPNRVEDNVYLYIKE